MTSIRGLNLMLTQPFLRKRILPGILTSIFPFNQNMISNLDTTVTSSYQTGPVTVGGSQAPIYTQIIKSGYSLGTFWGYQALGGVDPTTGNEMFGTQLTNLGNATKIHFWIHQYISIQRLNSFKC